MKNLVITFVLFASVYCWANNDKYRLIITDNPATTITIGWNQISGTSPVVHYGTTDFGTVWSSYPSTKAVTRSVYYKGMNNTFVKLENLSPNTNYYFVIKDSEGLSNRFWFKTAPSTNDRMSFIAGGDSRNNRTPRRNANTLVAKLKPTAVFFGGDMTNGDSSSEWKEWFDDWQNTIASDGRMFPIIPARGNHEDSNNSIYHLFNVPSTSVYYDITFGSNLYTVFTLNSEISAGGNQYTWLQSKLATNSAVWKSAQYHKPMRPHVASKSEGNDEYSSWAALFYAKGVNLVFESDSHTVKTTWPVKPCSGGAGCEDGFSRATTGGTVYVGEGCWGAPLRSANDAKDWTRDADSFNQFKWIFVEESKIEIRTVKVDNASQVGTVSNSNPFSIPSNIDLWSPANGAVITLLNSNVNLPEVAVTSPKNGDVFTVNKNISLQASASDSDGSIRRVDFYVNNTIVGTDASAPYSIDWTPTVNNQRYELKAIAVDNDGNAASSNGITIFVGTVSQTISVAINRTNDDVEEYQSSGRMYMDSSDLELVYDGSRKGNQHVGLLFRNLNIPKNATISDAYLQFTTDETSSGTTELKIRMEQSAQPAMLTDADYNVSKRTYLDSFVTWNPAPWTQVGQAGSAQRTPSLKSLVQQVVSLDDWKAGNNMMFYLSGTGERTAEAYDGSSSKAPKLVVSYAVGTGGGTPPTCEALKVKIVFDRYASETSWKLTNESGATVMSGSGYTQANGEKIEVSKCLPRGCYRFSITDSYGDGICCAHGNGAYELSYKGKVIVSGGSFGSDETKAFCMGEGAASLHTNSMLRNVNELTVYPTPVRTVLYINGVDSTLMWKAKVIDLTGKIVLLADLKNNSIDVSSLGVKGVYFVQLYDEQGIHRLTQKIFKE